MRKKIVVQLFKLLLVVLAIVVLAIGLSKLPLKNNSSAREPSANFNITPATEETVRNAPPLCEDLDQIALEFNIIDTAYTMINRYSIFREKAADPKYLSEEMTKRTFQFLSRPLPEWGDAMLREEQAHKDFRPARLTKRIYDELIKDPQYQDFVGQAGKNAYIKASINALIKAIEDPFAYYFSPEEWITGGGWERHAGSYVGMGITANKNERGEIAIQSVFTGSPAERAGIGVGDAIVAVDGKRTDVCSVNQFIMFIKSHESPRLDVVVRKQRTAELKPLSVALERIHMVELSTCPSFVLNEGRGETKKGVTYLCPLLDRARTPREEILYLDVRSFSSQVAGDLKEILSSADFTKISGIIIDVRENPGGLLNVVSDFLDYLLVDEDLMYQSEMTAWNNFLDRTSIQSSSYRQNMYNLVPPGIPIAVLVGKETFSAAEVFAGAMQAHGRAPLISKDDRTGGKGSISWYFELDKKGGGRQGALAVAIGFWRTPDGKLIQLRDLDKDGFEEIGGLKPDIKVELSDEDYVKMEAERAWYDPVLFAAIEYILSK